MLVSVISLQRIRLPVDIPEAEGSKRAVSGTWLEGSKTLLFALGHYHTSSATAVLSGWVFSLCFTLNALFKNLDTSSNAENYWLCIEQYFIDRTVEDTDFDL